MIKLFDYKFLITLGLSLVVYFLYREVEQLNKRVSVLESKEHMQNNETPKKIKKLIDLPPPPIDEIKTISQNNNNTEAVDIQMDSVIIVKTINENHDNQDNHSQTVEEYSNDNSENVVNSNKNESEHIYSHDNLNTNTNEQDTQLVESIQNMIKQESHESQESQDEANDNKDLGSVTSPTPTHHNDDNDNHQESIEILQENENNNIEVVQSEELINDVSIINKKDTLDNLSKKKLDELIEIANSLNININNTNGKRKKKAELIQDITNSVKS
jgi:hypothetical protein